jgi:hypothetical protein
MSIGRSTPSRIASPLPKTGRNDSADRRVSQGQCGWGEDRCLWSGITLASQDVENDIGGMDAVGECLGAGSLDCGQAVSERRAITDFK